MIRACAFDLECSSLNADFGVIGAAVLHFNDQRRPVVLRGDELNPKWYKGLRSDDSAIVRKVAELLQTADILVAHNGVQFDLPFLQSRLARWGLPYFQPRKFIDPVWLARKHFRLSSNSLDAVCSHLGIEGKTPVSRRAWVEAFLDGSRAAMDEIVHHCKMDVKILVELVPYVKPYCRQFDTRGSAW